MNISFKKNDEKMKTKHRLPYEPPRITPEEVRLEQSFMAGSFAATTEGFENPADGGGASNEGFGGVTGSGASAEGFTFAEDVY